MFDGLVRDLPHESLLGWLRQTWHMRRRKGRLAEELRPIYADRRRPQITQLLDCLVVADLRRTEEEDLPRRFEQLQVILRELAACLRQTVTGVPENQISLPSIRQLFEGLRDGVYAYGRTPAPGELLETLDRLHEPYWLVEQRASTLRRAGRIRASFS